MGKAFSVALRPWKNYNVRGRAHKILDADRPSAAPRHPSDRAWNEASKHELDEINKKDDGLLKNLKSVYVVSEEAVPHNDRLRERSPGSKPLPWRRSTAEYPHPPEGYKEPLPERVPEGKITLKQATNFIEAHQIDPENVTAKVIASTYRLDVEMVETILRYFRTFGLHVPQKEVEPTIVQRIASIPKMLESKSDKDDR